MLQSLTMLISSASSSELVVALQFDLIYEMITA